jgi:predicted amidophosphoribosyltransferase
VYELASRLLSLALDAVAPVRCAACGDAGHVLCEGCVAAIEATPAPLLAGVRAAFAYETEVRHVIHHGKFRDCRSALRALAWIGAPRLRPPPGSVVVAVPLATRRRAQRGYNQASVVAAAFAGFHRLPTAELLERRRDTPPQTTLDRAARLGSVAGAFAPTPRARGARVWLIDDVLTTGATTEAARQALADGGAARVEVAVLAAVVSRDAPVRPSPARIGA